MWLAKDMCIYQSRILLSSRHPNFCCIGICSPCRNTGGVFYEIPFLSFQLNGFFFGGYKMLFLYDLIASKCREQGLWAGIICALAIQVSLLVIITLRTDWDIEVSFCDAWHYNWNESETILWVQMDDDVEPPVCVCVCVRARVCFICMCTRSHICMWRWNPSLLTYNSCAI